MWDKPIDKYWERVIRISKCGLSAYYSLLAYNTYAVSCLEYLCQMYWVPPRLLKLEARAIAIILKIPYYAYGVDGPFQLKGYGIQSARSIVAMNFSAMFRASRETLKGCDSSWKLLVSSIGQISIEDCLSPTLSPPCWDSGPIVSRLLCAFNGFRDNYLGCIPLHLLKKIQGSFQNYEFLRPHCPPPLPWRGGALR